jgi:hypothetical protein
MRMCLNYVEKCCAGPSEITERSAKVTSICTLCSVGSAF